MAKVSQADVEAALGNGLDAPENKKGDDKKPDEKKDEKKPDDTDDPDDEDKDVDDKKDEKKDEKKDDGKKDDEKKDKKSDEEPAIEDDVIAKALEEKFDISNYKDLVETLEGVDALLDEHDKLIEENKKLKEEVKPELKFDSDSQKKVYEFLTKTGYDPERIGEGLMTHAKLMSMELGKDADPKMILEEKFVIEHPELTRDEAQAKFTREYTRKFVVDKTKFENDDEYKEEVKLAEIDKKSAVAKATEFLKKKQEEFKPAEKSGKKEATETKITKEADDNIKRTVGDFRKYMEGLETLTFTDEKNPSNTFTYSVPKKIQKQILEAGSKWLAKPELYNEKGEFSGQHNTEEYAHNVTMSMAWKDVVEKMLRHVEQKAKIINVEQKAEVKPERKGGTEKGSLEGMDFMEQAEMDANSRVKERKKLQGR